MTIKNSSWLKAHEIFFQRAVALNNEVKALSKKLSLDELQQHETVKLARRVYEATLQIIPQDPDHPAYRLKDELKKYRRYKQGLARYRLFFAFSSTPPIILYLYLNDKASLRKEGDKQDPYEQFRRFVKQGKVSHNPLDPRIQRWVRTYEAGQ
jgi:mRNA-degrading endonuclease RelE of RelBE toxin-antitoxin system